MTGRTRPPAATKRTSAFTHAIVVWLRKVLLDGSRVSRYKLTQLPEPYSVWDSALLGCAGARMVLSTPGIVQTALFRLHHI